MTDSTHHLSELNDPAEQLVVARQHILPLPTFTSLERLPDGGYVLKNECGHVLVHMAPSSHAQALANAVYHMADDIATLCRLVEAGPDHARSHMYVSGTSVWITRYGSHLDRPLRGWVVASNRTTRSYIINCEDGRDRSVHEQWVMAGPGCGPAPLAAHQPPEPDACAC